MRDEKVNFKQELCVKLFLRALKKLRTESIKSMLN